jgi:hypothetical protein
LYHKQKHSSTYLLKKERSEKEKSEKQRTKVGKGEVACPSRDGERLGAKRPNKTSRRRRRNVVD